MSTFGRIAGRSGAAHWSASRAAACALALGAALAWAQPQTPPPGDDDLQGQIKLVGVGIMPGDATDFSNYKGEAAAGFPQSRLGAWGSAIDYTGRDDLYLVLPDRGPLDGASTWRCRWHTMRITIDPDAADPDRVRLQLVSTTMLRNQRGIPLVGTASEVDVSDTTRSLRLDPEGIRRLPDGRIVVSDEYGPWVDIFDRDGQMMRKVLVPSRFRPSAPNADPELEGPPASTFGRAPNRGFEGLAISTDGQRLYAIAQSPLIQDAAFTPDGKRLGVNVRLLEVDARSFMRTRQYAYQLDHPKHSISEILAVDTYRFLVLERDGDDRAVRRLYMASIQNASDVSRVDALPPDDLGPSGIVPMDKALFLDLLDPAFGIAKDMPEKIEGLTWGPMLPGGRRSLLITTDNDLKADEPSRVWVFSVPVGLLDRR